MFGYRLFCWKLKTKNNKKITFNYYSHSQQKRKKRNAKRGHWTWDPNVHLVYNMKFTIMQDLMQILYNCTCSLWYNTRKTKLIYREFIHLNEFSHRKCRVFWFRNGYWITSQKCYHSRHGRSILWIFLHTQKSDMYAPNNFWCQTWFNQEAVHKL